MRLLLLIKSTTAKFKAMPPNPPKGWEAAECEDMDDEGFPYEDYQLQPGKMLLFNKKMSTYLLQSGGKFYIWNDISGGLGQIQEPEKLEDIYPKLSDLSTLKTVDLCLP